MRADPRFVGQPMHFWANIRSISQETGYTVRGEGTVRAPSLGDMLSAIRRIGLGTNHLVQPDGTPSELADILRDYFEYRADALNNVVQGNLMNADQAKAVFESLRDELQPDCPLPMNKQRGDKKAPAYFTCIINMLIEAHGRGHACDYDPRELTTITVDGAPLRTMARRVDGAFPGPVNPIAVWEIKEYYYTTTFGSRVADAVYETLLDGMELEELRLNEHVNVRHFLMIDAHYTWWECGRSYLCRILDMLHMGYVDEVLFGREILDRLPCLVKEWAGIAAARAV